MGEITAQFDTRAGSGSLVINHPGLPNTNGHVSKIDSVSVEYDLEDNSDTADTVFFLPSKFKFTCFEKLSDGSSLFNRLDSIPSTEKITVVLSFTTDNNHSWTDSYIFTTNDVEYDLKERSIKIDSRFDNESSLTVADIMQAYPDDQIDTDQVALTMRVADFVRNYFKEFNPSADFTNLMYKFNDTSTPSDGDSVWVISASEYQQSAGASSEVASKVIYKLAAFNGSFVGSILGYSFVINRLNNDAASNIAISEDNVASAKINLGLQNYRRLEMGFSDVSGVFGEFGNDVRSHFAEIFIAPDKQLNPNGTKALKIYFQSPQIRLMEYDSTSSPPYSYVDNNVKDIPLDQQEVLEKVNNVKAASTPVDASVGDVFYFATINDSPYTNSSEREFPDTNYTITNIDNERIYFQPRLDKDLSSTSGENIVLKVASDTIYTPSIIENALDAYKKAYGADGARLIELELLDIDLLKPFEIITLNDSFPSSVAGQTFRPTSLEYDLEADKISVKAYQM